jgi:hypothetical protein
MTERQTHRTYHTQAHRELNHLIEKHTRTGMIPQPAHSRHDARVVHNLSVSAPALHRRGHHNKTYQYEGRILKSELRIHPLASVPSASASTRTYRDERNSLHRDTPRPTTGARGSAGETHCRTSQQASVQARQASRCRRKKGNRRSIVLVEQVLQSTVVAGITQGDANQNKPCPGKKKTFGARVLPLYLKCMCRCTSRQRGDGRVLGSRSVAGGYRWTVLGFVGSRRPVKLWALPRGNARIAGRRDRAVWGGLRRVPSCDAMRCDALR